MKHIRFTEKNEFEILQVILNHNYSNFIKTDFVQLYDIQLHLLMHKSMSIFKRVKVNIYIYLPLNISQINFTYNIFAHNIFRNSILVICEKQ